MARDGSGPPDYSNVYNPQPPVQPGNVPYADYFRTICPGAQRPRNQWAHYKYQTTHMNIAEAFWKARERARLQWEANADELSDLMAHPPVVLWLPYVAHGACLACTWIDEGSSSIDQAASTARRHSVEHGADSEVVANLRVPVSERNGQFDEPLDRTWA
jgi:hypothetical protein